MRALFPSFFPLSAADREALWQSCFFVFDTSALLTLTALDEQSQIDAMKTLNKLKGRLWLPHQVALEFHANRERRIDGTITDVDNWIAEVNSRVSSINGHLEGARSAERGIKAEIDKAVASLNVFSSDLISVKEKLQQLKDFLRREDDRFEQIDNIFDGCVGAAPTEETIKTLVADAEKRYKSTIPPGYKDRSKERSGEPTRTFNNVTYDRKYGDLILWRQILSQVGSEDQPMKSVIFITDDKKEDWWEFQNDKRIGPRRELREEFSFASGTLFWMYSFSGFLKAIRTELNFDVEDGTIEATQRSAQQLQAEMIEQSDQSVWLSNMSRHVTARMSRRQPGPLTSIDSAKSVLYEVAKHVASSENFIKALLGSGDSDQIHDAALYELDMVERYQEVLQSKLASSLLALNAAASAEEAMALTSASSLGDLKKVVTDFAIIVSQNS